MRFFNTVLLLATTSLVYAGDVCPGTYCSVGEHCEYQVDGPHCCGADNNKQVVSDPPLVSYLPTFDHEHCVASMQRRQMGNPQHMPRRPILHLHWQP